MPIHRTYACAECGQFLEVTLTLEQWDAPPPDCPRCAVREMHQEFKPVAIGGSPYARARALAEDIAEKDYHVADMQWEHRADGTPKVRYKDETPQTVASSTGSAWGVTGEALQQAVALGREVRLKHGGSGLDMLQRALKSGEQPDLIEVSKRRAMNIW